jgi:3-hydroxybutyryl-CoA dehydrogenase
MGPFTLGDMVGIDVGNAAMASMYEQFFHEPAYAPTPLMALRAAGGLYGQKSGSGWYGYKDGKKVEPQQRPVPATRPKSVWVRPSDHNQDLQEPLLAYLRQQGFDLESGSSPSKDALIVLTPIGYDVTTAVAELKYDGARTVAVDVAATWRSAAWAYRLTSTRVPSSASAIRTDRSNGETASDQDG